MIIKEKGIRISVNPEKWKDKAQFIELNKCLVKKLPEGEREGFLSDIWDKASPPEKEAKPEKPKKGDK